MIKPIDVDKAPGSIDVEQATRDFFGSDTPLRQADQLGGRPYEERPQQRQMAEAIAAALKAGRHLCIEAPTGVGKTFAYLVPAILRAQQFGLPAVVSTHTISLQEQIIDKDLPILDQLLVDGCRYAIAKGRANYVCRRRLEAAVGDQRDFLPAEELLPEVERIRAWAEDTDDGSKSALMFEPTGEVWDAVCCESGNCLNAKCPQFRGCFLMQARRKLSKADVIVANHALFFTDLAMKLESGSDEGGMLPAYGAVVLDEGHCVEDTAAIHLGVRVSTFGLRRALRRLYNSERNRGLLVDVMYTAERLAVIDALDKTERFFARMRDWLAKQDENPLRYTVPGHVPDMLAETLETVHRRVSTLARSEEDEGRQQEMLSLAEQVWGYRQAISTVLDMKLDDHVYWLERFGPGQQGVSLNAVPIQVGERLRECLFNREFTVIMTSATLAVKGNLDYFQKRIGAEEADGLVVSSPFDFEKQVTLFMPPDMPNPKDAERFVPAACEQIRRFVRKTSGKAFVLFTSYRMMHEVATELAAFFAEEKLCLLVQGEGMPRSRMLQAFRDDVDSVLFGTASFWTGVDVPGEALSNVIIMRLPFAVPDHPLVAARQEAIERQGKNAFWEYSLPEAVLRFRQGFGRLIRSRDDHGIVVVLDNRITQSRYGRVFLDSIPRCQVEAGGDIP